MRYARRLVQLLEADLARERARIVELNATIETLRAERNDREAARIGEREPLADLLLERDQLLDRIAELETGRNKSDEYPSHHAAYHSGRRAVLARMRTALARIDDSDAFSAAPEAIIARITEAVVAEQELTE